MQKKLLAALLLAALSISTLTGCGIGELKDNAEKVAKIAKEAKEAEDEDADEDSDKKSSKKDAEEEDDDDVIVAGTVDTSSKFAFDITGAIIGTKEYSQDTFVVYVVGEFTNNSDENMDFSSIVDVDVKQDGFELDETYTRGMSKLEYAEIKPGESIPILLGYELLSYEDDVEIVATDRTHYANEVLYEGSYTIDELVANTSDLIDEYRDYVDDSNNDSL